MVIELEILFLTAFLLSHLLNYLHTMTLEGLQSCVLPSVKNKVALSRLLGPLPQTGPGFLHAWSLAGIPGFPIVHPTEGAHEKTKSKTRKK